MNRRTRWMKTTKNIIEQLKIKNKQLRKAVILLDSMVSNKEKHSDKSKKIVEEALKLKRDN